jgi:hypothetical protein
LEEAVDDRDHHPIVQIAQAPRRHPTRTHSAVTSKEHLHLSVQVEGLRWVVMSTVPPASGTEPSLAVPGPDRFWNRKMLNGS